MNTAVSGGSMDRQRRLQLISQNPVTSLGRLRTSTVQSHGDDDDADNNVTADDADDQLHQIVDQQVVVY